MALICLLFVGLAWAQDAEQPPPRRDAFEAGLGLAAVSASAAGTLSWRHAWHPRWVSDLSFVGRYGSGGGMLSFEYAPLGRGVTGISVGPALGVHEHVWRLDPGYPGSEWVTSVRSVELHAGVAAGARLLVERRVVLGVRGWGTGVWASPDSPGIAELVGQATVGVALGRDPDGPPLVGLPASTVPGAKPIRFDPASWSESFPSGEDDGFIGIAEGGVTVWTPPAPRPTHVLSPDQVRCLVRVGRTETRLYGDCRETSSAAYRERSSRALKRAAVLGGVGAGLGVGGMAIAAAAPGDLNIVLPGLAITTVGIGFGGAALPPLYRGLMLRRHGRRIDAWAD